MILDTDVPASVISLVGLHMKRATMELGGHAPVIVAEDADIALALKTAGTMKFRNAGQVCVSPSRFLVHNAIKAEFTKGLVAIAEKLRVAEGTQMDPLTNTRRVTAMTALTADAIAKGATLVTGGERIGSSGNFFAPTVFTDLPMSELHKRIGLS